MISKAPREFHEHPWGAFTPGESWIYFAFEGGPHGYALWGSPTDEDMERLIAVLEGELVREPPHTGLVDLRHLEGVRPGTYAALARYTTQNHARLREIVTHTAMVRPSGLVGLMAEGFFRMVPAPFALSYFTSLEPALAAMGHDDPAQGARELEEARASVLGQSRTRVRLTNYLDATLVDPSIEQAARAAGLSVRTLQRQLSLEGTSFAREVMLRRIARAKALLDESDEPISNIAMNVGFSTPQHFAEVFKREVGMPPNVFRTRSR